MTAGTGGTDKAAWTDVAGGRALRWIAEDEERPPARRPARRGSGHCPDAALPGPPVRVEPRKPVGGDCRDDGDDPRDGGGRANRRQGRKGAFAPSRRARAVGARGRPRSGRNGAGAVGECVRAGADRCRRVRRGRDRARAGHRPDRKPPRRRHHPAGRNRAGRGRRLDPAERAVAAQEHLDPIGRGRGGLPDNWSMAASRHTRSPPGTTRNTCPANWRG